jgi:hypothetical protein
MNFILIMVIPKPETTTIYLKKHKKARESATLLIPHLRLSHCPWYRISNAEAHALWI